MTVTGKELKGYMEWAAECYNQWKPGDINISFDPEYPGYLYDMFAGVEYEINLSKPKGERIENVLFHGEQRPVLSRTSRGSSPWPSTGTTGSSGTIYRLPARRAFTEIGRAHV